jgi:lipid II:glycine glycyltransferase (peptidoglycan interpeptide bridge formation enzyme)
MPSNRRTAATRAVTRPDCGTTIERCKEAMTTTISAPSSSACTALQTYDVLDRNAWNAIVLGLDGHVRQTWGWGALCDRPVHRRVIAANGHAAAAIALTEIALPGGAYTVLEAPRGPVLGGRTAAVWPAVMDAIREVGARRRALFVRLSPPTSVDDRDVAERLGEHGARALDAQWTLWNLPRVVMSSDASGTELDVKRRMRESTRQSLKKAVNRGAKITLATDADAVRRFHGLLVYTGRRKSYPVRRLEFFEALRREYLDAGAGVVVLATYEGRDIAGVMGVRFGRTGYVLYAGLDQEFRALRAGVAVHWELIRWAREQGCDRIDWGGSVTNYPPSRSDDGYGIYDFKSGFGCEIALLSPYLDIVLKPVLYRAFRVLEQRGGFLLALRSRFN